MKSLDFVKSFYVNNPENLQRELLEREIWEEIQKAVFQEADSIEVPFFSEKTKKLIVEIAKDYGYKTKIVNYKFNFSTRHASDFVKIYGWME